MASAKLGNNTTDDHTGTAETQIAEGSPTTNYGSDDYIEVTKYFTSDWRNSLLKFTGLSGIPAGSTITAVSIFLYQYNADLANGTYVVSAKRMLRNWVEAQATWNVYSTGNNWTTAGAFGDATDRVAAVSFASAGLDLSMGAYKELVGNSTGIADVQNMLDGGYNNYGWLLERTDGSNDFAFRQFRSSAHVDGQRPYMLVTYTEPSPSVAPAGIEGRVTRYIQN